MATKEEISMIGFEIVAYAGDAQTDLLAALDKAREGDIDAARELHASANQALIDAHDVQTKLLSQEAGGGEMDVTFIMVHAQDTLMTTMMLEKQARFMIDGYRRIAVLEAKLSCCRNPCRQRHSRNLWATLHAGAPLGTARVPAGRLCSGRYPSTRVCSSTALRASCEASGSMTTASKSLKR